MKKIYYEHAESDCIFYLYEWDKQFINDCCQINKKVYLKRKLQWFEDYWYLNKKEEKTFDI